VSITTLIVAFAGILGALVTYSVQRALDRQHAVLTERRRLYEECAAILALLMYKKINIKSETHFTRRDKLNIVGQRIAVLAPSNVRNTFMSLVKLFSEKEQAADSDGLIEEFFDDQARIIVDQLLDQMRKDALPKSLW